MVIFESGLSHRVFSSRLDPDHPVDHDALTLGLTKAAALVLYAYFGMKVMALAHGNHWNLLNTGYGAWFLVELIGFVALPCIALCPGLQAAGTRGWLDSRRALTAIGIVLNRLNVSIIAFNWQLPVEERYFPIGWRSL